MTDPVDAALLELQREYLRSMPKKLDELRSGIAALGSGAPESEQSLRDGLHRLAGSGGSFGFSELSGIAREGERWLAANPGSTDTAGSVFPARAARGRREQSGDPARGVAAGEKPSLTPRALLIMRASQQRERIAQELRNAGYELRFGERQEDPASIPTERLPHLVIIGGEAGDGDLSAVASRWTSSPDRRPGAVVLVETLRPVDRLRAIAAGVDAVFPAEQVEQKLPRYARTFARIGPPPSNVVLVEPDPARATRISTALDAAHIRVTCNAPSQTVTEAPGPGIPDLLLLSTRLKDSDPFALARMIRQDARYHLLPIVFVGEDTTAERVAALRAGADDFVSVSSDSALLVQTVIARAARGRRIREMVHRDGLTGLLNHATLMAELEGAVDFSRRYGEPLAFVIFELANSTVERATTAPAGDEVMLHVRSVSLECESQRCDRPLRRRGIRNAC